MTSQATECQFKYLGPRPQIRFSPDGTVEFMASKSFKTPNGTEEFNQATQDRLSRKFHRFLADRSFKTANLCCRLRFATDVMRTAMDEEVTHALKTYTEEQLTSNAEGDNDQSELPTNEVLSQCPHKMSWMPVDTLRSWWDDTWDYTLDVSNVEWSREQGKDVLRLVISPIAHRDDETGPLRGRMTKEAAETLLSEAIDVLREKLNSGSHSKDISTITKVATKSLADWAFARRLPGEILTETTWTENEDNEGRRFPIDRLFTNTLISTSEGNCMLQLVCSVPRVDEKPSD